MTRRSAARDVYSGLFVLYGAPATVWPRGLPAAARAAPSPGRSHHAGALLPTGARVVRMSRFVTRMVLYLQERDGQMAVKRTKKRTTKRTAKPKKLRVGFIGISNHNVDVARAAVESGLVDVLMFPVNLYQHHEDPARAGLLDTCAEHQVGVVAMKPFYGGRLLTAVGRPTGITPAQCLHFVLSQPVVTAVPGARNVDEMRQALRYVDAAVEERRSTPLPEELTDWLRGQCVRCEHCLPCPQEIHIPMVIYCLDYVEFYSGSRASEEYNRELYAALEVKASACIECGVCLERCPFDVDIMSKISRAVEVFETGA